MINCKKILNVAVLCLLGMASIIFGVLYLDTLNGGTIFENIKLIKVLFVSLITVVTILSITFYMFKNEIIYKLLFTTLALLASAAALFFVLDKVGFMDKFDSQESLRDYIRSTGNWASVIFVVVQFLQVTLIPIPAFITIGAGIIIFPPLQCVVLSSIGIILGSITAFAIGKVFGKKVASWIVGKDEIEKWQEKLKGKDKIILTLMFLLPFFPDDILCFIAGLSTMNFPFFIIMITISRLITITISVFSISFIPFNTWWGLSIWGVLIIATFILMIYLFKHGEDLEKKFFNMFKKKKNNNYNDLEK